MKSFNQYFDKIYCVHIGGVADRRQSIETLSNQLNCEINWFDASTPNNIKVPSNIKILPGEFCCAISHIRLWNKIIKDNPKRPLIIEDDAFVKDPNEAFKILERVSPTLLDSSVDLAYLGVNYRSVSDMHKIIEYVYRIHYAYTTHAYSPSVNFLKDIHKILNIASYYEHPTIPIDVCLARLMKNYNCMTLKPSIISQKEGFSFVQNKNVDFRKEL